MRQFVPMRFQGVVVSVDQDSSVGVAGELAHLAAAGDWDVAVERGTHYVGIDQVCPDLFAKVAALLLDAGMTDAAEAYLCEGSTRWPDNIWLPWHHAKLADRHRDFDTAAARWRDLMARYPQSPLGLCGLAELHRHSGRENEATRLFADAVTRYSDYVWAAAGHALTPTLRGDWSEAIRRWLIVRDTYPELLHAHAQLVHALTEGGWLLEAREAVRRGLVAFPQAENLIAAETRIMELQRNAKVSSGQKTAADSTPACQWPTDLIPPQTSHLNPRFSGQTSKTDAVRLLAEAVAMPDVKPAGEAVGEFLESALRLMGPSNGTSVRLITAAESDGEQTTIFETSVRRLDRPTHLTGRPACFPSAGAENAYSPALKVLSIPKGVLCHFAECSVVFSSDGQSIIQEYSSKYSRLVQFYDANVHALITEASYIDGIAVVLPDDIRPLNFSHWLVDWLPRLAFLGAQARRPAYYVLTTPLIAPFQIETLRMCGFERSRIIEVRNFQAVRARELLVTSDLRHIPHPAFKAAPWAVAYLQSAIGSRSLLAHRSASAPKKLYISRADARGRRVANEDELFAMLSKIGYVKIVLSSLTLSEQVALFVGATHVVGIHGAGFAHLVFLTESATVVEIFPATHGTPAFYILTAGLQNRYASYLVSDVVATGTTIRSDFNVIVDVVDFEQRCADLL